ncbi:MAG: ABC transporter substrate-binding protein, partial [Pseudomonadales bacterium]
SAAFASKEKIIIVHSYSSDLSWVMSMADGIKKVLGDQYHYEEIFMDTKNIDPSEFQAVADSTLKRVNEVKPRLVLVSDDNALKLVGRYIDPSIPVIFGGINASLRDDYPWLFKVNNITGVLERPLIKRSLQEAVKVFGIKTSKLLVMMDDSQTAKHFFKVDLDNQDNFPVMGAQVDVFRNSSFQAWQEKILAAKEQGYGLVLLAGAFAVKAQDGSTVSAVDLANWISKNSPIPPFTVHFQQIGKGKLIGGLQLSGTMMGTDMGNIAKEVLDTGVEPRSIFPKTQKAGALYFSREEIERQGLTLAKRYKDIVVLVD